MDNERMAIVETEVKHISIQTLEIKNLLVEHIEKDANKMTRAEAYKAFAYKHTEVSTENLRIAFNRAVWWGIGAMGTLVIGLVLLIFKG